jgi:glutamyl-tRNA synthetase
MSSIDSKYACGRSALEHPLIGRLAPSPTGPLHLGHARSFLLAWWQVRKGQGRLLLRQEDLDGERSRAAFRDLARIDLEWLGLDWDGPEWIQSEHVEQIHAASERLVRDGYAYPCVCSRGDIHSVVGAPHAGESIARYPGTCRGKFGSRAEAESQTGKLAGIRALVPDRLWHYEDGVCGHQSSNVAEHVGDFLIVRRDKVPSYQLAVVVDDARQGVTSVVRGEDLLDSTPRQLFLYAALGLTPPQFFHVPLVVDATGARLAKRSAGLSLQELRERGVDPRRIVAWVAQSAGMAVGERVTPGEVTHLFDMAKLPRNPAVIPTGW